MEPLVEGVDRSHPIALHARVENRLRFVPSDHVLQRGRPSVQV